MALIESWAPPAIAWDRDNVGLLAGSHGARVRKVLVCLDVTPAVVDEAASLGAGLIVSHHPLIFTPLRRIDPGTAPYELTWKQDYGAWAPRDPSGKPFSRLLPDDVGQVRLRFIGLNLVPLNE